MKKENSSSTLMALQSEEREINKVYHCEKLVENPASGVALSMSSCNKLERQEEKKKKGKKSHSIENDRTSFWFNFPCLLSYLRMCHEYDVFLIGEERELILGFPTAVHYYLRANALGLFKCALT